MGRGHHKYFSDVDGVSMELCNARAEGGLCTLPRGHNMGNLDVPSAHQATIEPQVADFIKWADKNPAVTWAGKLGLKERWLNRNNPEYQKMLKARGEK